MRPIEDKVFDILFNNFSGVVSRADLQSIASEIVDATAAPDLLEALQDALIALENSEPVMKHYPEPNMRHIRATNKVEQAIKKALGDKE